MPFEYDSSVNTAALDGREFITMGLVRGADIEDGTVIAYPVL